MSRLSAAPPPTWASVGRESLLVMVSLMLRPALVVEAVDSEYQLLVRHPVAHHQVHLLLVSFRLWRVVVSLKEPHLHCFPVLELVLLVLGGLTPRDLDLLLLFDPVLEPVQQRLTF